MMNHLDEGALQALLDGELTEPEEGQARGHLSVCGACEASFRQVRESAATVASALLLLDAEPATAAVSLPPPSRSSARRPIWRAGDLPRAAAILLGFAAAASATVPGSPVRSWLVDRFESPATMTVEQPVSVSTPAPIAAPVESGVSVAPNEGRVRIVLTRPAPGLRIRAVLTDSPRGGAFTVGSGTGTRFESAVGTIEVVGASGDELRLEIPRSARTASVEVDGAVYLVKEGDQLRLITAGTGAGSAEVVFSTEP